MDGVRQHCDSLPAATPPTQQPAPQPPLQRINASVGDIIRFENYRWQVLEVRGNQALIMTERIIDRRKHGRYDWGRAAMELGYITWETSEIRQWLNGEFFSSFSSADQARIMETRVVTDDIAWRCHSRNHILPGGNDTIDRIFLLSSSEVYKYYLRHLRDTRFDSPRLREGQFGVTGQVGMTHPPWDLEDRQSPWLLRSHGEWVFSWHILQMPRYAGNLVHRGEVDLFVGTGGVRPALWLNLGS